MKKYFLFVFFVFSSMKADFILVNKTGKNVEVYFGKYRFINKAKYTVEPETHQKIDGQHVKGDQLYLDYLECESAKLFFFKFNDEEYAEILKKSSTYMPVFTVTHDPKNNSPKLNAPATTDELKKQIEQIKKETISKSKKLIKEAVPELPGQEGGVVGLIGEYAADEA